MASLFVIAYIHAGSFHPVSSPNKKGAAAGPRLCFSIYIFRLAFSRGQSCHFPKFILRMISSAWPDFPSFGVLTRFRENLPFDQNSPSTSIVPSRDLPTLSSPLNPVIPSKRSSRSEGSGRAVRRNNRASGSLPYRIGYRLKSNCHPEAPRFLQRGEGSHSPLSSQASVLRAETIRGRARLQLCRTRQRNDSGTATRQTT